MKFTLSVHIETTNRDDEITVGQILQMFKYQSNSVKELVVVRMQLPEPKAVTEDLAVIKTVKTSLGYNMKEIMSIANWVVFLTAVLVWVLLIFVVLI